MKPILSVFVLCLLLNGCGNDQLEQARDRLKIAQKEGRLSAQESALKALISEDQDNKQQWQQLLDELTEVQALNQQAQTLLANDPIEALKLAAKADQMRSNQRSRQMIAGILKPYVDFIDIFKPLREWAYPTFEKVVTPNILAPGMEKWQTAAQRPSMWPENHLSQLIAGQYSNSKNLFYGLAAEYKQFYEFFVVIKRMSGQSPNNDRLLSLLEDATVVNQMYNAGLSDLLWYYCKQSLTHAANANQALLEQAQKAQSNRAAKLEWPNDHYYLVIDTQPKAYEFLSRKKNFLEFFTFVDSPSDFDRALRELANNIDTLIDNTFVKQSTPSQQASYLKRHQQQLTATITQVEALANAIDRADIAAKYLYITYSWQNNNLYELEQLVPYIKHYKDIIHR